MVEAKLVHRRRVDPAEADAGVADLDVVALADFWDAGDVGGLCQRRQQHKGNCEQESHQHSGAVSMGMHQTPRLWCGFGWHTSAGAAPVVNLTREASLHIPR